MSLLARQALLRGRLALADQTIIQKSPACQLANLAGQQGRLVIPTPEQPPPVQGHGHQSVSPVDHVAISPRHPFAHCRGQLQPIGMLETQNDLPGPFIIFHQRTRLIKQGRAGNTGPAQGTGIHRHIKRIAAAMTTGLSQKIYGRPAGSTKLAILRNRIAAPQAPGRKKQIQHRPPGVAPGRLRPLKGGMISLFCHVISCHTDIMTKIRTFDNKAESLPEGMAVFDRDLVRRHRDRAAAHLADHDFLLVEVAERLCDRLADINRRFNHILVIGCGGDMATALHRQYAPELLVEMDLSAAMLAHGGRLGDGLKAQASEEFLPFADKSFDLVVVNMTLHWVNDLPGALIQINRALKPDGLFQAACLGGQTLVELRNALAEGEIATTGGISPRISPFADIQDFGGLLQRGGFTMPVVDSDMLTVTYGDVLALMRDIRGMGEANAVHARHKHFTRRETIAAVSEAYAQKFAREDGRLLATFQIFYLAGWAPDASQPKALRPGSAKARLADALKVPEVKLKE